MVQKVVPTEATLIPATAERVFEGIIYDVYHWQQKLFDDSEATFEMLRRADTVSAVCIADGKIIVLRDEQPHRGVRTTFPGGRVESDEDTLAAVKREVHEETGYSFDNWRLVRVYQPHTKIEWFVYLYLAWDGKREAEPHLDAGEKISLELLSFARVKRLIEDKVGYMGESSELFLEASDVDDLLALPEFSGKTIEK